MTFKAPRIKCGSRSKARKEHDISPRYGRRIISSTMRRKQAPFKRFVFTKK